MATTVAEGLLWSVYYASNRRSSTHQLKKHSCCFVGICLILCAILPTYYSQTIVDKPIDDEFQCPGQVMVFTCETRGSLIITWRSIEYIGVSQLQFSAGRMVGDEESASKAVANLIRNDLINEERVMESELHITLGSGIPSPTITCARDNGSTDSVTLRILQVATDIVPIKSDQRKNSAGGCVIHFSWAPPGDIAIRDISHFKIAISETPIDDEKNISMGFFMRSHPVCSCGTHYISIATVNRCDGEGPNVTELVDYPASDAVCKAESDSIIGNITETKLRFALITVSVIAGLLLIAAVTLLVVLILVCCGIIPHNKLPCVAV